MGKREEIRMREGGGCRVIFPSGMRSGGKEPNLEEEKEKDSVSRSLCSFPGATRTSVFPAVESKPSQKNFYQDREQKFERKPECIQHKSKMEKKKCHNGTLARPKKGIPHLNLHLIDSTPSLSAGALQGHECNRMSELRK